MTTTTIPDEQLPVTFAIFELGRKARREGVPFENNPYGGLTNHSSWNLGWKHEEKRMCS